MCAATASDSAEPGAPIAFAWQAASGAAADGYLRIAGGNAPQLNGSRTERAGLATLRPAVQQGVAWVTLMRD